MPETKFYGTPLFEEIVVPLKQPLKWNTLLEFSELSEDLKSAILMTSKRGTIVDRTSSKNQKLHWRWNHRNSKRIFLTMIPMSIQGRKPLQLLLLLKLLTASTRQAAGWRVKTNQSLKPHSRQNGDEAKRFKSNLLIRHPAWAWIIRESTNIQEVEKFKIIRPINGYLIDHETIMPWFHPRRRFRDLWKIFTAAESSEAVSQIYTVTQKAPVTILSELHAILDVWHATRSLLQSTLSNYNFWEKNFQ